MNIELPKDAEGREIPLDTTAMYGADGKVVNISRSSSGWACRTETDRQGEGAVPVPSPRPVWGTL